jgi:hypothetical protein
MEQPAVGFERDIRPLFRPKDIARMKFKFDLSSYEDVSRHRRSILRRLSNGPMPCDGAWPPEQVGLFQDWVDADFPA